MFDNDRQQKIIEVLSEKGSITVDELKDLFKVSNMTIRRDLDRLQEMDYITRFHGGAMLTDFMSKEMTYFEKQAEHVEEKRELAKEAVKYIRENSVVYLDAGTTTLEIAKLLSGRQDLNIVTNDLRIAIQLSSSGNKVFLPGGLVSNDTGSVYSPDAIQYLKKLNIDIAFLAASSIDKDYNVCTPDEEKMHLKKFIITNVPFKVLVADKHKYSRKSLHKIFSVDDVDVVVTNYEKN